MSQSAAAPTAIIVGASYAGLVAAVSLQAQGWNVQVIERSRDQLRTGGGVVVQKRMADYLEKRGLRFPDLKSVPARERKILTSDGNVIRMPESVAGYAAWDVLLRQLEDLIGPQSIHRGLSLVDLPESGEGGQVVLSDGTTRTADVVIAADGIGSRSRTILLPEIEPTYAGYIALRGTVSEQQLSDDVLELFSDSFTSYERNGSSVLAYEIPGADGETAPGQRRLNWVWYENVIEAEELESVLTDTRGEVHRSTIPRGMVPRHTLNAIRTQAEDSLLPSFAELVCATEEPFVQAIQDLAVPRLVFGRTVLVGDAACLVRPHVGSGTAKAVDDAVKLAEALSDWSYREHRCLAAWEHTRLQDHHALVAQGRALAARLGLGWEGQQLAPQPELDEALALAGTW